ncbi:uncharacterized protein BJ212DRAFT_1303870 [Suillus subaureus]|uniref:Uncharacterized protein n=1 Tax=Suillus subaureus TaxID=48587 RepID=A0A9P7J6Y7_9AGAM|nr:uncharacterized protein BJ212DRAFT_1303870 [Suillus subaureus]KAG1805798.1 hypothetical protein BJ212DRAFT_1303870 [Suillus subaureus]
MTYLDVMSLSEKWRSNCMAHLHGDDRKKILVSKVEDLVKRFQKCASGKRVEASSAVTNRTPCPSGLPSRRPEKSHLSHLFYRDHSKLRWVKLAHTGGESCQRPRPATQEYLHALRDSVNEPNAEMTQAKVDVGKRFENEAGHNRFTCINKLYPVPPTSSGLAVKTIDGNLELHQRFPLAWWSGVSATVCLRVASKGSPTSLASSFFIKLETIQDACHA